MDMTTYMDYIENHNIAKDSEECWSLKINSKYYIYSSQSNTIVTNLFNQPGDYTEHMYEASNSSHKEYVAVGIQIIKILSSKADLPTKNQQLTKTLMSIGISPEGRLYETEPMQMVDESGNVSREQLTMLMNKLISFFSEYNFSPSYRFVNTLCITKNPMEYVANYFLVQNHTYTNEVAQKIQSPEFKSIVKGLQSAQLNLKPINTRFELFYGDPGAGKTTKAYELTDRQIVCTSDMLPVDLMQNFEFDDGKADFKPSALWTAMVNGESILLDEINMLPFESLRFLQGITDNKDQFDFKGHTIKIHENFKIYATMNLNVNGQIIPIPEPLVDRACEIKEFKLTADDLVNSLLNPQ